MSESKASLTALRPARGSTFSRRRVARGPGSGLGKTAGRGHKGQKSRAGKKLRPGFEGGQMPLHRRIPKRGFRSRQAESWLRLPTAALSRLEPGEVSIATLKEHGFLNHRQSRVKLYSSGEVKGKYVLTGISVSAGARALIEVAGGSVAAPKNGKPKVAEKKAKSAESKSSESAKS